MSNNGKHVPPDQEKETIKAALEGLAEAPPPTKEEIEAAKDERQPSKGKKVVPIRTAIPAALKKQAAKEHRDWKSILIGWINQKSKIQWYGDGSYQFILPPPLVKMIWQTTLKERIKYVKLQHKGISDKEAAVKAVESINAELDGTAKTVDVIEQRAAQVKEDRKRKASEEEQEAADSLVKLRAEMVGSLDEDKEGA